MKLLSIYNRVYVATTIPVLLFGGFFYYLILRAVLLNQLDKDLTVEEQEIKDYIRLNHALPNTANYKDQKIVFQASEIPVSNRHIKSILAYDKVEEEQLSSRQLVFPVIVGGKYFKVSITKSQQETEDLIQLIVLITLSIAFVLLLALFIINRFILNKLWNPFNHTLEELKQFNVSSKKTLKLNDSYINEFKELNNAVTKMSSRVIHDYDALRSFTENASHEIQTPLAIVNSKLELLIQSENFTEQQMRYIQTIYEEISRLSKLNNSLLLLTKIDNFQFQEIEQVDMSRIINTLLSNYEELLSAKKLVLTKKLNSACILEMNETMAQILVSNLITNAIKHNNAEGVINIELFERSLIISNTGPDLNNSTDKLFERFKKDRVNAESLGLGLSIVKKICDRYNYIVSYSHLNGLHTLVIQFS